MSDAIDKIIEIFRAIFFLLTLAVADVSAMFTGIRIDKFPDVLTISDLHAPIAVGIDKNVDSSDPLYMSIRNKIESRNTPWRVSFLHHPVVIPYRITGDGLFILVGTKDLILTTPRGSYTTHSNDMIRDLGLPPASSPR